ncbi:anti-sigma factor [Rubrobacter aplysinae]|uniref:zf-HC2 domain-containing protein n=1 Tax=Rubrobacter aplysinae TaxID=909625 RepID=UPI00064B9D9C|nr:zf-HC2 domain-containing protein [Rubrobacter aplysinae]
MSPPKSGSEGSGSRCRNAEEIFDLCEGSLEPAHEREVISHLRVCAGCREAYRRENSLTAALSGSGKDGEKGSGRAGSASGRRPGERRPGTASSVAMAIPTRSAATRAVWGVGAAALLAAALFSLSLRSVGPITFLNDLMAACWGLTSGLSDATGIIFAVSGGTVLVALIVGTLADALIAVTLLAVARWWRPRGA